MYYYGVVTRIFITSVRWKKGVYYAIFIFSTYFKIHFISIYVNYKVDRGYYIDLNSYLLSLD